MLTPSWDFSPSPVALAAGNIYRRLKPTEMVISPEGYLFVAQAFYTRWLKPPPIVKSSEEDLPDRHFSGDNERFNKHFTTKTRGRAEHSQFPTPLLP